MGTPPLRRELAEEAVRRVEDELRAGCVPSNMGGGRSAVLAAADKACRDGFVQTRGAFEGRLRSARDVHGLAPDETLYRPRQYQHRPPGLPIIPDQGHLTEDEPDGEPEAVAVIGDAHDSPHLRDKDRFRWLGAYIAERGLPRVMSVGDWLTLDSFSSHTDRATFEGLAKPTFEQDLDSFHESQRAFHDGLGGHKPKKHITLGNHEARAWKYDNLHPDGISHSHKLLEAFAQWGWTVSLYGEYKFIQGVGFVHVPFNALGRPLAQGQRPNKAMFDTIHGDDHRATQFTDFKSGPFRSPTIYSAATALPPGFIEGFANKGGSTWRSGICEAVLWGGHVRKWSFEEMILLRRRYGPRLAA
jgi:hypothetical protein